jgi:hypothetical protein
MKALSEILLVCAAGMTLAWLFAAPRRRFACAARRFVALPRPQQMLAVFFFYRLPWTQSFKWEARCTDGPNRGKVLSSIERQFKTSGHWLWNPKREGWFL